MHERHLRGLPDPPVKSSEFLAEVRRSRIEAGRALRQSSKTVAQLLVSSADGGAQSSTFV